MKTLPLLFNLPPSWAARGKWKQENTHSSRFAINTRHRNLQSVAFCYSRGFRNWKTFNQIFHVVILCVCVAKTCHHPVIYHAWSPMRKVLLLAMWQCDIHFKDMIGVLMRTWEENLNVIRQTLLLTVSRTSFLFLENSLDQSLHHLAPGLANLYFNGVFKEMLLGFENFQGLNKIL